MQRSIFICITALSIMLSSNIRVSAALRAAWSFEEKDGTLIYDSSGNCNIGYIQGEANRSKGEYGNAIRFNGVESNTYIEIPEAEDIQLHGSFTIECRLKLGSDIAQVLFRKGERWKPSEDPKRNEFHNYMASFSNGKIIFSVTDENMNVRTVSAQMADKSWHLLDFVYDGQNLKIYIDKILAGTAAMGNIPLMTEFYAPLYIGNRYYHSGMVYGTAVVGYIDEFRIYDEALFPEKMGVSSVENSAITDIGKITGKDKYFPMTIAADGKANAAIVIKKDYTDLESIPAKELQTYIQKQSGARLPIIQDDTKYNGNMILVGESKYTKELGIDLKSLEGDSYIIKSLPGTLILAGHDKKLDISNPPYSECLKYYRWWFYFIGTKTIKNGTLNAVYAFLQDHCGIRWFMPGKMGEYIPKKQNLEVPAFNILEKPYRLYVFYEGEWKGIEQWNDRNFMGKSAGAFVFDPTHDWDFLISPKRYYDKHPAWFAMRSGKRVKADSLCVSNKEMREEALKNLKLIFDAGFEIADLIQSDGYQRCQCPECEAQDAYRDNVGYTVSEYPAYRIWNFHDYLAREIQKIYPDRKIVVHSYGPVGEVPVKIPKLSDNIRISLCYTDSKRYQQQIALWKSYKRPQSAYLYWFDHERRHNLPPPYNYVSKELQTLEAAGIDGFWFCGGAMRWGVSAPTYYMTAKLLRNPNRESSKILKEFCEGMFGSAAVSMESYFNTFYSGSQRGIDLSHKLWIEHRKLTADNNTGKAVPTPGVPTADLYLTSFPEEILHQCSLYLKDAKEKTLAPEDRRRVEFFADAFEYIRLTTLGFKSMSECKKDDWSTMRMRRLLDIVAERNNFVRKSYEKWQNNGMSRWFSNSLDVALYGITGAGPCKLAVPFEVFGKMKYEDIPNTKDHIVLPLGYYGAEGLKKALQANKENIFPIAGAVALNDPATHPVIIVPQGDYVVFNIEIPKLRDYVMRGGSVMLTHDAVGVREFKAAFPEIGEGIMQVAENTVKISTEHPVTAGMNPGNSIKHDFYDHIVLKKGPQGIVLCEDLQGRPVMIAGTFGKGKVILNGMLPGYAAVRGKEQEQVPSGRELDLLLNTVSWLKEK